jgi:glycosyltransferase involved in cell wall biosynthesis
MPISNDVRNRRHSACIPTIEDYKKRPPHSGRISGGKGLKVQTASRRGGVITVITVSFNSARTIEKTIDSIIAQTYPAVEYIIIDGGSADGTVEVLRKRNSDIDLWISEPDEGISDAFNKGISLASGEFVALVNSDDWLEPEHLSFAAAELGRGAINYVFGDLVLHSQDGEPVHFFVGEPDYAARIAHYMPFINHPSVVSRYSAFQKIGLFDPSLRTAMDYDWFLRLHKFGGVGGYSSRLTAHMTLDGQSDRNFYSALREVRKISVRAGYSEWLAWGRYAFRLSKGVVRRITKLWLPSVMYEGLRRRINRNYRSADNPRIGR